MRRISVMVNFSSKFVIYKTFVAAAEKDLEKLVDIVGGTECLLHVVMNVPTGFYTYNICVYKLNSLEFSTRQAAAIRLKNIVAAFWATPKKRPSDLAKEAAGAVVQERQPISPQDRQVLFA